MEEVWKMWVVKKQEHAVTSNDCGIERGGGGGGGPAARRGTSRQNPKAAVLALHPPTSQNAQPATTHDCGTVSKVPTGQ